MEGCESGGGDKAGVEPWTPDSRSQRCSLYAALADHSVHTTLVPLRRGGNRKTAPVMDGCESGGDDKAGVEPWTPDSRSQRCSLYAALAGCSVHTTPTASGRVGDWKLTTAMDVVGNGLWALRMADGDEARGYMVEVSGHGQCPPALAHVSQVGVPLLGSVLRCEIPMTLVQGCSMLMVLACARTGSRNGEVVKAVAWWREGGAALVDREAHHHRCDTRSLVLLLMNATELASQINVEANEFSYQHGLWRSTNIYTSA